MDAGRRARETEVRLIGREREMAELALILGHVRSGRGHLVLITGEAGMGKTALAEELANDAHEQGARVIWGNCWETVDTPPYWPWIQAMRQLVAPIPPERLASWPAAALSALHQIAPDFPLPSVDAAEIGSVDRFALFDGVWSILRLVSADEPLVIVLEDLHAADESSLHLLQFVSKQVKGSALLIVGSYDAREVRRKPGHARLLADIARDGKRLDLEPLGEDAVEELHERETGVKPSPPIAAAVARASEGNPFFIREAIGTLTAKGTLNRPDYSIGFRVPHTVRDMVRSRLAALPEDSIEILGVASVAGRRFDINVLASVTEIDVATLLELLQQPLDHDVIEESSVLGNYSFTHILIRETLYEDLTAAKRMRLHRRMAETLEDLYADDPESVLPELAHHWFKAGHAGDLNKTVEHAVHAAEQAARTQAYEEAVRLYQRALKASESTAVDRGAIRELKLALREAQEKVRELESDPAPPPAPPPSEDQSFLREGEYWTVIYQGRSSRLRDTKGIRYLAHLLANPGREVHVVDLVQAATGGVSSRSGAAGEDLGSDPFGGTGEVLDARAKSQYKQRLDELRVEVEEAEDFNDVERAARAREEMEALVQQLAGAVGLGGRSRKLGSPAERARVNVTKTIKEAMRRVGEADPTLGQHLSTTIRTGAFCAYTPDPRVPIRWRL